MPGPSGASTLLRQDLVTALSRLPAEGLSPEHREALRDGRAADVPLDALVDALDDAGSPVRLEPVGTDGVDHRALFHATAKGFCVLEMIYDEAGEAVDYRFIEANPAFEDHTGLADPVGRTAYELVPGLERHWVEIYDAVARTGEPTRFRQGAAVMGRVFDVEAVRIGRPSARRVALLFTDVTEKVVAEEGLREANETLEAQVHQRTDEVRALARALTMAEQEVRKRIAHVLHDDLQQVLHGAQIAAQIGDADRLESVLDRALTLTRLLAHELSPPLLSDSGLSALMHWLADNQGALYGLRVDVDVPESVVVPEEHLRILLYQLVRELLFNVAKHAQTRAARIRAETADAAVRITVEDDGVGFTPPSDDELRRSSGLGLSSVWDRLALVGGSFEIESAPGAGTRLVMEVPASVPAAAGDGAA